MNTWVYRIFMALLAGNVALAGYVLITYQPPVPQFLNLCVTLKRCRVARVMYIQWTWMQARVRVRVFHFAVNVNTLRYIMKYWIQRQDKNPIGPFNTAEYAQAFIEKHQLSGAGIFGMDNGQ